MPRYRHHRLLEYNKGESGCAFGRHFAWSELLDHV